MKKYLIFMSLMLITAVIYAQPRAKVEQDRAVYEHFKYQPVLVHTFEIRNIGDQDLEILRVRPT